MKKSRLFLVCAVLLVTFSCNLMEKATPIPPTQSIPPTPTQSIPLTPTQSTGSIKGILWHDICKFTGGEAGQPVVLGQGCVKWGTADAEFGPNQKLDEFETGWAGVTLHLGAGKCPSTGLATAITDSSGKFRFEGLESGTYCVFYSSLTDKNDAILIPGEPTFPARGEEGFSATIDLLPGEEKTINFGYAWQFFN
jgi:hypothetical protein